MSYIVLYHFLQSNNPKLEYLLKRNSYTTFRKATLSAYYNTNTKYAHEWYESVCDYIGYDIKSIWPTADSLIRSFLNTIPQEHYIFEALEYMFQILIVSALCISIKCVEDECLRAKDTLKLHPVLGVEYHKSRDSIRELRAITDTELYILKTLNFKMYPHMIAQDRGLEN